MVDGQRREWWHEERSDLQSPETRPHLNSVVPGVEVRGPQTLGSSGVVGATTTIAIVVVATTTTTGVVLLLLVGLLWLLRVMLVLLLS
jgi:hypothetical protein